jgi:hypothetical protein
VDGVLLVAAPATPKRVLRSMCSRLNMVNAKVLKVVFNRLDIQLGNDGYYYSPDRAPVYRRVVVPGGSASLSQPNLETHSWHESLIRDEPKLSSAENRKA